MNSTTKIFVMAILSVGAISAAEANTYNVGPLTATPYLNTTTVSAGPFSDHYNFSVAADSTGVGSVINIPLTLNSAEILDISGVSLSVFDSTSARLASGTNLSFSAAVGSYYALITGTADGSGGGAYTLALAIQPVPLPPALWLLGSGLLGLLGLASRRLPYQ